MQAVKLANLDLNLLLIFNVVMRERSITRAAAQLGLSQPALSHALARLRHALKDELFLRTPAGMVPTPRSEQLAWPVQEALAMLQAAVEPTDFTPAAAERVFRVALDSAALLVLAARLVGAVSAKAPGVRLDLRSAGTLDVEALIEQGKLDLAVHGREPSSTRFVFHLLYEDRFVLVLHRDRAPSRPLDAAALAAMPMLETSSSGDDLGLLDDWLGQQGLRRQVAHRAPCPAAAVALLSALPLAAVMPAQVAASLLKGQPGLRQLALPEPAPTSRSVVIWHRRLEAHPAHRWLRSVVREIAVSVRSPTQGGAPDDTGVRLLRHTSALRR